MTAEPSRTLTDAERERLTGPMILGTSGRWILGLGTTPEDLEDTVEAIVAERVAEARREVREAVEAVLDAWGMVKSRYATIRDIDADIRAALDAAQTPQEPRAAEAGQ